MIIEQHGTHITNKAGSFLKFRQKEIGNATWWHKLITEITRSKKPSLKEYSSLWLPKELSI